MASNSAPKKSRSQSVKATTSLATAMQSSSRKRGEAIKGHSESFSCNFFLADDFRLEVGGKMTAVGLFGDSVVVIEKTFQRTKEGGKTQVQPIFTQLTLMANVRAPKGDYEVKANIVAPSGQTIPSGTPMKFSVLRTGQSANLGFRLFRVPFTEFGKYRFILAVGRRKFEHVFEIRHGKVATLTS
jgi:hypothetical protein